MHDKLRLVYLTFVLGGGGEGGHFDHTICIFLNSGKMAVRSAAVLSISCVASFPHPSWNFSVQGRLISCHQVTSSDPNQVTFKRHGHSLNWINTRLSGVDKGISSCKTFILEFRFQWLKVRPVCGRAIIRQWENGQVPFILIVRARAY